ncbi:MAG: [FeFe] hydrogenase H-cluster maturation GTPase HydF [Clostridia bacterium]|nr:[FeFe] hydrogenase H-cluster maturation GTPase HydF [Clostridia bacterium]
MLSSPRSGRLHIVIFGRRNAGKSSLINALTNQDCALVSPVAGTTTDPVFKTMEVLPLGPVVLIDTAGIDDDGSLGSLRVAKTMEILRKTDLAVVVVSAEEIPGVFEEDLIHNIKEKAIPLVGVVNKSDLHDPEPAFRWFEAQGVRRVVVSALTEKGIEELKGLMVKAAPEDFQQPPLVRDLIKPGEMVILVTPIDSAAPKGRLILPQVQVLRDVLDGEGLTMVVQPPQLPAALEGLQGKAALVVTDSQAFKEVAGMVTEDVPLTSFSIIMARYKGDLQGSVEGLTKIKELKPSAQVLIAEGCTHHRQDKDIGRVQIPALLNKLVGGELAYTWSSGGGFPKELTGFDLILHCGGCMLNRKEMLYRLALAREAGVPLINYGILLAYANGILPRVLAPLTEGGEKIDLSG